MTLAPPRLTRGARRPLLAHLPRAFWVCLVKYPIAIFGSVLFARSLAEWLNLNIVDAIPGWGASALLASSGWYALEPWVQRLWGARLPTVRELWRLTSASSDAKVTADVTRGNIPDGSRLTRDGSERSADAGGKPRSTRPVE